MTDHAESSRIVETIWRRDIDAFVERDWGQVEGDFDAAAFCGHEPGDGDAWTVAFSALDQYRDSWLRQAEMFAGADPHELTAELEAATSISTVDVHGDRAVARKVFDGVVFSPEGPQRLEWVTHYFLRRDEGLGRWLITGFVGGLPLPGRPRPSML